MNKFFFLIAILCFILCNNSQSFANTKQASTEEKQRLEQKKHEIQILETAIHNEIQESLQELAQNKEKFLQEYNKIKQEKIALEQNVQKLQREFEEQKLQINALELEFAHQKSSRKALEGAVKISAKQLVDRLQTAPYATSSFIDTNILATLSSEKHFPSYKEVDQLLAMLTAEIANNGKISIEQGTVYALDGTSHNASILKVGAFFAAAKDENDTIHFLLPSSDGAKLLFAPIEPDSKTRKAILAFFAKEQNTLPVDLSHVAILAKPDTSKSFIAHILAGGALIYPILLCGLFAGAFGVWRLYILSKVKLGEKDIFKEFYALMGDGKFSSASKMIQEKNTENVITYSFLHYMLTHWNNTILSLEKSYEEAMNIFINPLEKGITFVAVCAGVAPLLGLLGTVTGMIDTFDVITMHGNSDPKMLSEGISVALVTTELGLMVAIPLMFLHFFISRKVEIIEQFLDTKASMCIARASLHIANKTEEQ